MIHSLMLAASLASTALAVDGAESTQSLESTNTAGTRTPLWGFADLHAHPASHVSFGADKNGNKGIFWGKPGSSWKRSNPAVDMPKCRADSHYGFDEDPVRKVTRRTVIGILDGLTGFHHGNKGGPSFRHWPSSQSIIHQQMHITAIRRAYDGGLRVMVASVTDSQMLSNLWTKAGFHVGGNSVPKPSSRNELASAKRQIAAIRRMVKANKSWMRIVRTAAEARRTIADNKLAIVLGVEMDSLTLAQILDLVRNHDVRHVIPIHLTNNSFGGAAVYSDVFNAATNYLNGSFFAVKPDRRLEFRLSRPEVLGKAPGIEGDIGAIAPLPVHNFIYLKLGYHVGKGGHRNVRGLEKKLFKALMAKGLLLDVAHMSENATQHALGLSKKYRYPLMNSHTGLRDHNHKAFSERDMKQNHARSLAEFGGVLGLGTEGTSGDRVLLEVKGSPIVRFTGSRHKWSRALKIPRNRKNKHVANLRITITTGGDDLRGGKDNLDVIVTVRKGSKLEKLKFRNVNEGRTWSNEMRRTVSLPVNHKMRLGDLVSVTLVTRFRGGFDGDNWNVNEVRVVANEVDQDPVGAWLAEYQEAVDIMGPGRVAFGTDINGFAAQIPFASKRVRYPFSVARRTGSPPAGYEPPKLDRARMGSKRFDFRDDGLAHYGMLPDMLEAVSRKPGGREAVESMYRSADAFVRMWEKVERARKRL